MGLARRERTRRPLLLAVAALVGALAAAALVIAAGSFVLRLQEEAARPEVDAAAGPPARELAWSAWDEEASPNYVTVLGSAVVDVRVPAGQISYSPLDEQGRAGRAVGTITLDMVRAGIERERGDILSLHPSGLDHNREVDIELPDGSIHHGFFWNRSHLVAKSLGGSDELENLVCGTRMQNVGAIDGEGGMSWCEGLVRDWLFAHPKGTVYFSAQPVYEGDELVCRSVIVDIRSSDGSLDLEVEVHNCARGYVIDYATGEFSPAGAW